MSVEQATLIAGALPSLALALAAVLHVSNDTTVRAAANLAAARVAHTSLHITRATPWRSVSFHCGLIATIAFAARPAA